jgi:glycosyltransferase involved in cell wall biosynthesis
MRIVIDMQGAQTESRFRGIGRYTLSFAQAIVRNRGEHEVVLALSGLFPDTIESIRGAFDDLLPQENIRVWYAAGPVRECEPGNQWRRETAELIREAFLASHEPDVIHATSLFEGYIDDAVTSIGRFDRTTPVTVSLYDLIPLLNPDHYLKPNSRYAQYYQRKVEYLRQSAVYLAISEFTRQEGLEHLDAPESHVVNVATAIENRFQPCSIDADIAARLRQKFGLSRPFLLYTGGADERKNLPHLIQAFAALPPSLRTSHQLLFGGKMTRGNLDNLQHLAKTAGLAPDELCFTSYVTDDELVQLYNLCELFVFPSWHEGFGLPALEAMACGAPVIGANTSSLPEVIGLDEALFDPFDVHAISKKMAQALQDENFRNRLREHGLQQARAFSWDETAKRAIRAWEALPSQQANAVDYLARTLAYSRLIDALAAYGHSSDAPYSVALAACLAQNGSAGVERQLMLDVSELCQRDSATGVQRVVRSYLKWLLQAPPAGFRVEPVYASQGHGYRYARAYTQRFLGLDPSDATDDMVRWQRGDIFFGLDMQHHVQLAHADFYQQLKREGVTVKFLVYDLLPIQLADLFKDSDAKNLHEQWLAIIAATDGAICISKATADAYDAWIEHGAVPRAPTFRTSWVHIGADIEGSKPSSGLSGDAKHILATLRQRPTLLCVSTMEPRKRQQQVLEAIELLWHEGVDLNLVFVGQQGWKTDALAKRLRDHTERDKRLYWLEGISDEYLEKVYASSTCLIAASINEGFGLSLIEAARHGIPIVARDIPVFREVAGKHAYYFRGDAAQELAAALKTWLGLYKAQQHPRSVAMPWSTWQQSTEKLKRELVEQNYPRRQLLVDISELVQRDAKSGIQRVVRSILKEWLTNPPAGYRVEPVYATLEHGYRYARRFAQSIMGWSGEVLLDDFIDFAPGDIFFGLDFQPQVQFSQRAFYQALRRQGVRVEFLVHDLLCVLTPQYFSPGSADGFTYWLEVVAESDGAVCVSETTAKDLAKWIRENVPARQRLLKITWSHNGADVGNSHPTKGLPVDVAKTLDQLRARPSFLMVGTLEPRKAHAQVLDAFEQLWPLGVDANLVIVGKQGWMVNELVVRLRAHPELGKRLFWLEDLSDEYVEKVYTTSTSLIAAAYGEGFGLPLIEAAQHKLPIIARDIPVFREVAGEYAYYFDAASADGLAQAIKTWLFLYENKQHPQSDGMPWLTWKQSARQLSQTVLGTAIDI